MKIGMKKFGIIAVIALFLSLPLTPASIAESETAQPTYPVTITSIDDTGTTVSEIIHFTINEINFLTETFDQIQQHARDEMDLKEIVELLLDVFNSTHYPILSRILSRLIDTDLFIKGNFVVSKGWSRTLNPFSDGEISVVKMISLFRYREDMGMFGIPSTTTIIDPNPFELESYSGNHVCFLFRFKGIYIHITKPFPQQSFRYILGMSRYAAVLDI
jgi:hypothetical protein